MHDEELPPLLSRRALYAVGETLLTAGLVLLLFGAYQFYGKAWAAEAEQHRLDEALRRLWELGRPPRPGEPTGRLHVPRLDRRWVVTEGVTTKALAKGPGHYPDSDDPGEVGNVAIAGHRMTSVFWNLDRLRRGDPVILETRTGWFVYRVYQTRIVRPHQVKVVSANPDDPGRKPTRRLLTLTTCNPKFDNYQRLIVHAELQRVQSKRLGRPAELR